MPWKETVSKGAKKVGEGAGKAYDFSKNKAEQIQAEMKMDALAKKLGYMTFDAHRGREVSEESRTKLLADFTAAEAKYEELKAEAAARHEAAKAAKKEYKPADEEATSS